MDVVCVGDCGVDVYRPSGETLVGGITANVARHARSEFQAGDTIRIVSSVGDDDAARLVLDELSDTGIDCHIPSLPGKTPVQRIEIDPDGEKNFVGYEAGVLADLRFSDEQSRLIAAADLVIAPVYLQIVGLFDTLMSIPMRGRVAIDFADFLEHPDFDLLRKHIDRVDIGFFGLTPDDTYAVAEIARLATRHNKLFIVTLGAGGSLGFSGSEKIECAAVPVSNVVDTTGAGDAYAAAFLAAFCHGADIASAMRKGAELAATVIARMGSHRPD
jgi:fructoselysine 6-kinase